jgi:hypothetical protein
MDNISKNLQNGLEPCRNCKSDVKPKQRKCPYCGILNPTVKVKDIVITMFFVIVVMFTYTLTLK